MMQVNGDGVLIWVKLGRAVIAGSPKYYTVMPAKAGIQ